VIVLDTHVLVWWVSDPPRLSATAKRIINQTLRKRPVSVSAISVLEITTAVRRGRLALRTPIEQWLTDARALPELHFESVTVEVAALAGGFDETLPGDPADRIIVATALSLGAKLVTADERLRKIQHLASVW